MKSRTARLNDWLTDPKHNRLTPLLLTWTAICLFVMTLYFKTDKPEVGAIWALFALLAVVNLLRSL